MWWIKLFSTLFLSVIPFIVNAQYLRDSTKILNCDSFYPDKDPIVQYFKDYKKYTLSFDNVFNIPEICVEFENVSFPLYFDFGNSGNIVVTTVIKDSINYLLKDISNTYNPDGTIRDKIIEIEIPVFNVFDTTYKNENSILANWNIYSTNPFKGLIGLKYLENKCFTLDCIRNRLVVSSHSIISSVIPKEAELIYLETYKYHPFGIHFSGEVNGKNTIIYFDTGKSHSAINRILVPENKIVSDKSGSFYAGTIEIFFGNISVQIEYPRVKKINRTIESDLPVGVEVGIDILKYFILTIDRTNNNNMLLIHK